MNIYLFKVAAKIDGLYLKDLTNMDINLITMKYYNILGEIEAVYRHVELKQKIKDRISSEKEILVQKRKEFAEYIEGVTTHIDEVLKVEQILKNEINKIELVELTMQCLAKSYFSEKE